MVTSNITFTGHLGETGKSSRDGGKIALIGDDGLCWSFQDVEQAFQSADTLGFSGRIGVMVEDRLLAGLVCGAVMRHATCVPLDPKMTVAEFEDRRDLLGLKTLVIDNPKRSHFPASSVLMVDSRDQKIRWQGKALPGRDSNDALVLMTSGSTGRPKIVSLSHDNLLHSTAAIAGSLALSPEDRAVNLLPMSHIGGLVDLFLVPLISGGSVVFGKAESPGDILSLLVLAEPTWLQTAPAILRGLVRAAPPSPKHHLRLIRSVSAPLPVSLHREASEVFGVPIIEMYGMSETGGVITSNPLPPEKQKVGSVGKAVNCQVRTKPDGEIAVRSKGLFQGYQNERDNDRVWDEDWFLTGDLGRIDGEGYLFLTGRTKELINRGGQKVSPSEIDQLVETWDEISEAAAFGFPHPTLGEEVGLAFVLHEKAKLTDRQIKERLSDHLTEYKRPKRLLRLDELPRNQNGKIQRFALAGMSPSSQDETNQLSPTALKILPIWKTTLQQEDVNPTLDFFDQGGDSLSATTLLASIEKKFRISLSGFIFYENATLQELAEAIDERQANQSETIKRDPDFPAGVRRKLLRYLSSWPGKAPFAGSYLRLDDQAPADLPILFWCCNGIKELETIREGSRGLLAVAALRSLRSVRHKKLRNYENLASVYRDEVERAQPEGPLLLGGFCEGGRIMALVGEQLAERGRTIQLLILQDFNLERPFPAQIALIQSRSWKRNPARLHHDIEAAWKNLYQGRFGVMEKESSHAGKFTHQDRETLRRFLVQQLEESRNALSNNADPVKQQKPDTQIECITKVPFILKRGQTLLVRVRVTNRGATPISRDQGAVLHARWVDLNRDHKPGAPMYAPLDSTLKPGESTELELTLLPHKPKRLYELQIAVIEEGWGWTTDVQRDSHRHWHLIL